MPDSATAGLPARSRQEIAPSPALPSRAPRPRFYRSLTAKAAVLAIIFLAVPIIVYDQFRAADEAQKAVLLRSVREHGHVITAAVGNVQSRGLSRNDVQRAPRQDATRQNRRETPGFSCHWERILSLGMTLLAGPGKFKGAGLRRTTGLSLLKSPCGPLELPMIGSVRITGNSEVIHLPDSRSPIPVCRIARRIARPVRLRVNYDGNFLYVGSITSCKEPKNMT